MGNCACEKEGTYNYPNGDYFKGTLKMMFLLEKAYYIIKMVILNMMVNLLKKKTRIGKIVF